MSTILTILLIHWIIGIVFAIGVIAYGAYTNHDILVFMVGRPMFFEMLFTGFILGIPTIIYFFYYIYKTKKDNEKFLADLLNIPHREEIDKAWLDISNNEWYKSAKYNVKEGGWMDSILFCQDIDKDALEREDKVKNFHMHAFYRPKSLSHLN